MVLLIIKSLPTDVEVELGCDKIDQLKASMGGGDVLLFSLLTISAVDYLVLE